MPLNKDTLGAALKQAADAQNNKTPAQTGDLDSARLAFWTSIADTIISHIKSNATVTVNVTTTGTATAHTGTGTGTIQ
jgi:hypothetical protein